jgi:hypothetical protein
MKERERDSKNFILAIYYYGLQPLKKFNCTFLWMQKVVALCFYITAGIWSSIALLNETAPK